ncbi:VWA domain-containing protein [Rathayibacter sp. YIM 133350]|uniref:VWA domain-containing protein n=1 Tax=Rathayibacter sp. YIM 133350 TaxID=3131992 RepID=UPI00307E715D
MVALSLAVAAVLVVTGAFAWTGGWLGDLFSDFSGTADAATRCSVQNIDVVADPAIARALKNVARDFDEARHGCVSTRVRAEDSADTASILAAGNDPHADVWVPDSPAWSERLAATAASLGRPTPAAAFGPAIASSPLVFAAPATQATEYAKAGVGWSGLLAGTLPALLPDPEGSAASLTALGALQSRAPADDPRPLAAAMIALGKTIPRSVDAALAAAAQSPTPTAVITTEQQVVAANTASPQDAFLALYPADGTASVGFPFVRVQGSSTGSKKKDALVAAFQTAANDASEVFAEAGFRNGAGGGRLRSDGVLADPVSAPGAADGAAQLGLLRTWSVLTLRSRMLALIDVSGSMEEPTESGLRRIDIFQQAATGAMQKFSGEVEMGVWVFSTKRAGDQDWEDLSPIAPLGDAAHSQQIADIIASLPSRLGGATGLYDTTLAAVARVRESYDPTKVNSVLLITDGKNEDEGGISLDDLLAKLAAQNDPRKPVPVILIGFGPDTDLDAMTKIAKTTGGAAYTATRPEDLGNVLVDALSQRSCRPNCS